MKKRLVCIVEGRGELKAIPNLCARIFEQHLNTFDWIVHDPPIRNPRDRLVDQARKSPMRSCNREGLRRLVLLARQQKADSVLVLCDSDDDCPAKWGPDATQVINGHLPGGAVMALREYETWLLLNYTDAQLRETGIKEPEFKRGAKEALAKLVPGYLPTTHQLTETRKLNIARVRQVSDSFDKLVRILAHISGTTPPARQ